MLVGQEGEIRSFGIQSILAAQQVAALKGWKKMRFVIADRPRGRKRFSH